MKTLKSLFVTAMCAVSFLSTSAQEFSAGMDFVSSYIWRGVDCGSVPALQPGISYSIKGLEVGAWGSSSFDNDDNVSGACFEADLYASYSFDFGLSLTFTDYYFGFDDSGKTWTDSETHTFEIGAGYEIGNFSIMGAYMFDIDDLYFEASYAIGDASVFVGAGNDQYTWVDENGNGIMDDGEADFNVCNIGVSYSKEINITDKFALPLFGSVILNPSTGGFYTVAGLSF